MADISGQTINLKSGKILYGVVDGWMDGRTGGLDGLIDRRMDGKINVLIDGWMNGLILRQ